MTTYNLPADGVHEFDPTYLHDGHAMVASGSGTVTVEYRHPGSDVWRRVPGTLDASTGNIIRFTGSVDLFRFTLSGSTGGASVEVKTQAMDAFESILLSGPDGFPRLRTDNGEPGFWAGRQFGVSYEFSIASGTRRVLKFETPVDAILYSAQINVDQGDLYYRVYGSPDDSIETSSFDTPLTAIPLNTMTFTPSYTGQVMASTGGDIDETGLTPFPVRRIRTADNSNFRQSAGAEAGLSRGFAPGFAYILMTPLSADTVTGVLDIRYEERGYGY